MRKALRSFLGLALLSSLAAHASETELNVTCITKDLPAGAKVWLQVAPESYQTPAPTPESLSEASGVPEPASGASVWRFEVPVGGAAAPATHRGIFPTDLQLTSAGSVGSIRLKVRFKVDAAGRQGAYGEVIEADLGMPVPAGKVPLSRCLRLREEGNRLILDSAPACSDAAFARVGRNGRTWVRQPRQ